MKERTHPATIEIVEAFCKCGEKLYYEGFMQDGRCRHACHKCNERVLLPREYPCARVIAADTYLAFYVNQG